MPKAYEPRFSKEMRRIYPILRGFENKIRQGISPIQEQDRKITLAKRAARKQARKKPNDAAPS